MPRPLSTAAKQAIFAQETGQVFLQLLTITHPSLVAPLRFVNNTMDVVSRGETYLGCPFEIDMPEDREDQIPRVTLSIENVSRTLVETIRSIATPPELTLEVVLASSPDTVEAGPIPLTLRDSSYDAHVISGELAPHDILNEPAVAGTFTPTTHPGLFP